MTIVLTTLIQHMPSAVTMHTGICIHCAMGNMPFKMKRQTVHHFPDSGKIAVCEAATLKPSA